MQLTPLLLKLITPLYASSIIYQTPFNFPIIYNSNDPIEVIEYSTSLSHSIMTHDNLTYEQMITESTTASQNTLSKQLDTAKFYAEESLYEQSTKQYYSEMAKIQAEINEKQLEIDVIKEKTKDTILRTKALEEKTKSQQQLNNIEQALSEVEPVTDDGTVPVINSNRNTHLIKPEKGKICYYT